MSTPTAQSAPPADTTAQSASAEALGWQLRAALPPMRLSSVSLYDREGDVLWLSEGALGPDEHTLVIDALGALGSAAANAYRELDLGDGRGAVFLAIRSPHAELVGLAMILADAKCLTPPGLGGRILTSQVRAILQRLAILLRSSSATFTGQRPALLREIAEPAPAPASAPASAPAPAAASAAAPAKPAARSAAPRGNAAPARPAAPAAQPEPRRTTPPPAALTVRKPRVLPAPSAPRDGAKGGARANGRTASPGPAPTPEPPARSPAPPSATTPEPAAPEIDDVLNAQPQRGLTVLEWVPPVSPEAELGSDELTLAAIGPARLEIPTLQAAEEPAPRAPGRAAREEAVSPAVIDALLEGKRASRPAAPRTDAPAGAPAASPASPRAPQAAARAPARASAPPAAHAPAQSSARAPVHASAQAPAHVPAHAPTHTVSQAAAAAPVSPAPQAASPVAAPAPAPALPAPPAAPVAVAAEVRSSPTSRVRPAVAESREVVRPTDLHVCELVKLRPGGRTRRFEILTDRRAPAPGAVRATAARLEQPLEVLIGSLEALLAWRRKHLPFAERDPLSFGLAVSGEALAVDDLPARMTDSMRALGAGAASIGFELQESLCVRERARAARFIAQCERLGCFVVLDDFSFDSAALEYLRSPALRLVKVDPKLTSLALRDKLAQARVIAIAQAVRVLGIHCSAKQVDGQTMRRWLTGAGFDFAQGPLFEGPRPLETLADAEPAGEA